MGKPTVNIILMMAIIVNNCQYESAVEKVIFLCKIRLTRITRYQNLMIVISC